MSNGGIIGPVNIPTTNTASGIWTLEEQQLAKTQNIWPTVTSDPYFEYTTLLLPGNGTNGAQNNTFLDGSTNNFTITRNGNTTQGTFSPFSQTGWGNYFNGTTAYLSIASNAVFGYGTNDFTIECFFYLNALPSSGALGYIFDQRTTNPQVAPVVYLGSSGSLSFYVNGAAPISGGTVVARQWNHLAVARSSGTTKMFLNGSQIGSNYSDSNNYITSPVVIASRFSAEDFISGYVSNFRIVKGRAVYTSDFSSSIPTSPLTRTTGGTNPPQGTECSLLTCQSNRFLDSNGPNTPASSPLTITANGSPSVQAFSPFNPSASWSAATNGGSGYFDGSGDYLSVADNAALELGSSSFCIEVMYYPTSLPASALIFTKQPNPSTDYGFRLGSYNGVLRPYISSGNTSDDIVNGTTFGTLQLNTWNHIAIYRVGTAIYGSLNGTITTLNASTSLSVWNNTAPWVLGALSTGAGGSSGYFSDWRIVIGSGVYTSSSAPFPTAPLTAITNTSLLTNFTNAGIYDATSKNDLETVGNAQISTTQSKWGGSSISFDGTGDWLLIPDQPPQRIGTGNFTVEMWVYRNSSGTYGLAGKGTGTTGWLVSLNSSNQVVFTYGSSTITSSGTVSATTWTHIAVVREGTSTNQTKIYINGTNDGTGTVSTDFNQTNSMYIGADRTGGSAANAYVQDVRITNFARYTANFAGPLLSPFLTL